MDPQGAREDVDQIQRAQPIVQNIQQIKKSTNFKIPKQNKKNKTKHKIPQKTKKQQNQKKTENSKTLNIEQILEHKKTEIQKVHPTKKKQTQK